MIYTVTLNPAVDFQYVVPRLDLNQVLRATHTHIHPGGKGFNVSRMLAELQVESTALGIVGGQQGNFLKEGLQALGIETKLIEIAGETRVNVSVVTERRDTYFKVNEAGPQVEDSTMDQLLELIKDLASPGDWWVLSGSVPPGVDANIYAEIINTVRAVGASTILDTSGQPLSLGVEARPTIVKPNAEEALQLTQSPFSDIQQTIAVAGKIRQLGAENVVISLDKDGAVLHDGKQTWFASAPVIFEKNSIGAGDSLVAGLVHKLVQNEPLPQALKWGIACGSATASQSGTSIGAQEQIAELANQIEVKEVTDALHN